VNRRARAACVALALAAGAGSASAQAPGQQLRDPAADSIDFGEKGPAQELPLKLPAAPKPDSLIGFDPGRPTTMKFFVDPASISVGSDGIVRYTLVARGDGAAMNVSFEGIRCGTREHKIFAYGRADGSWHQPRDPQWTRLSRDMAGPWFALYQDFFCPARQIVSTAVEAVEGLRAGQHPRAADLLTGAPIRR
jgi:hypothetical protein